MKDRTIRHKMILLLIVLCTILFFWQMPLNTEGCTVILIGKEATSDGSVILAANDDWPGYPSRLVHVPGKRHASDEQFILVRGGKIPQARRTFAYKYVCSAYGTGTRKVSWIYGVNENQVAVAMAGTYNFKQLSTQGCQMEADDLPWLVLERAQTARDGIEIMTSLMDKYGFAGGSVDEGGSVTMAVADTREGWWFEPIPGGVWLATRVPDNRVTFRPNCIGTHVVDFNDGKNVLSSKNMVSYATRQGWYQPGTPFDYTKVYCLPKKESDGFHETDPVNALRRWRMASLFSGKNLPEETVAYEVLPQKKISVSDVMTVLRDYLQGTPYDLSKVPEAGPHGNPFHSDWGNSLSRAGTVVSIVIQLRDWLPDPVGGVMWVAFDTPTTSVYIPWYLGANHVHRAYGTGEAGIYDRNSAWWHYQEVGNLCYRRFNQAALIDVIPVWRAFENEKLKMVPAIEQKAVQLFQTAGKQSACKYLTKNSNRQAEEALQIADRLENVLRGRYLDHSVVDSK